MTSSHEEVIKRIKDSQGIGLFELVKRGFKRSKTYFFYFSFVDDNLPEGQQFLGGCYIPADTIDEAIVLSMILDINPGGEIRMVGPIPLEALRPGYADRLLMTKEEIDSAVDASKW